MVHEEQHIDAPNTLYTVSHSTEEHGQSSVETPSVPSGESHTTGITGDAYLTEEHRSTQQIPSIAMLKLPTLPVYSDLDADAPLGRSVLTGSNGQSSNILRSENVVNPDGTYHYRYSTSTACFVLD